MKKLSVTKIIVVISVVIIALGIMMGIGVSNSIENSVLNESIYVDGSNFSGIVQIVGFMGSRILGILIVIYSFIIDAIIWLIYGIVVLIIHIIRKIKNKGIDLTE